MAADDNNYSSLNLVVPWGIFGAGNIGDEATLQGFAKTVSMLEHPPEVRVASRQPRHDAQAAPTLDYFKTSRIRRQRVRPIRTATHLAIVGDTPITDVLGSWPLADLVSIAEKTNERRLPLAFIGVGTEPLAEARSRFLTAELLARTRTWSVRTERDRDRLLDLGGDAETITVAADLAWLAPSATREFGERLLKRLGVETAEPVVGVNLHPDPRILAEESYFLTKMGEVLRDLTAQGSQVVMLSNEIRRGEDRFAREQAISSIRDRKLLTNVPRRYWTPQQMMSLIACCDVLVGMRYHACLFAAVQNVPFVAISRRGKLEDLCWDLEWDGHVPAVGLDTSALSEVIDQITVAGDASERLRRSVARMVERAAINTSVLESFLTTTDARS